MNPGPQLRDIQLPPEPGLWPWPPGVWLLLLLGLAALIWLGLRMRRAMARRRLLRRWREAMRRVTEDTGTPAIERVAAASELLRRAMRRHDPVASTFDGAAWRERLASLGPLPESDRGLAVLVEGPWRMQLVEADAQLALSRADERLQRLLAQWP